MLLLLSMAQQRKFYKGSLTQVTQLQLPLDALGVDIYLKLLRCSRKQSPYM